MRKSFAFLLASGIFAFVSFTFVRMKEVPPSIPSNVALSSAGKSSLTGSRRLFSSSFSSQSSVALTMNAVRLSNLLAYWRFDEGTGDRVKDSSGRGYHGLLRGFAGKVWSNEAAPVSFGSPYAMDFDGIDDWIDLGSDLSIVRNVSAVTLSAWVRPDSIGDSGKTVVNFSVNNAGVPTADSRALMVLNEVDEVRVGGRSADDDELQSEITTGGPIVPGQWHHVAGVIDYAGDDVRIYVNGVQQATAGTPNFSQSRTANTDSTSNAIGSEDDGSAFFFDGFIDDVRVFPRALSASEIESLALGKE